MVRAPADFPSFGSEENAIPSRALVARPSRLTQRNVSHGHGHRDFVLMLKNNGLFGSMGRVAAAGDNARMESFHSLLQNNVLDTKKWETREELRLAIVHWIERTYHRRRRKRSLGRMTPVEFEAVFQAVDEV